MASESNHWKDIEKRYSVHPETKSWYAATVALGKKSYYEMKDDLEGVRADEPRGEIFEYSHNCEVTNFKGTMEEIQIPSQHYSEGVQAQIYRPEIDPENPTIILYVRGGGLVVSQIAQYQQCVMSLVEHTDAIVVLPEYRSLPCTEDRFAPFTDVETVSDWLFKNKTSVGGVASSKVGVVGDSAGGQLGLSLSYTFHGRFDFQVIVYPVTDFNLNVPSMKEFWTDSDLPGFCGRDMGVLLDWCQLLEHPSQVNNPRVNPSAPRGSDPANDPPLSVSPPTLMIIAELDSLRDWGVDYAHKLSETGAEVELHVFKGVPHGFFSLVESFPTQSEIAHKLVADFIKKVEHTPS